jgi:hypothetical protein
LHRLFGLYAVKLGPGGIKHHSLLAQREDAAANQGLQRCH